MVTAALSNRLNLRPNPLFHPSVILFDRLFKYWLDRTLTDDDLSVEMPSFEQ